MSNSIPPTSQNQGSPQSSSSSNPLTGFGGVTPNANTFLTLLVAQLKNQDPLNPTDSTQFVAELAQFSSLEQLMNINKSVGAMQNVIAPPPAPSDGSSNNDSQS